MARLTLQARHSRSCALYPSTSFEKATKKHSCTCAPSYALRGWHKGELTYEAVGQNRREAQRALDSARGDIAKRVYRITEDITFEEWGPRWLASFTGKENSRRVYAHTIAYAIKAFGDEKLRDLGPSDIGRFLDVIRKAHLERQKPKPGEAPKPLSDATLAKHLRQLQACLEAAIPQYASSNPVKLLHKSVKPKPRKGEAVYYTDVELARLWPELEFRPVVQALCKTAVATGARFGELVGLRWGDIDLLAREIHVSRTVVDGQGEQASTKSGESRTLDLTPPAARLLEEWYADSSSSTSTGSSSSTSASDDGLVFEREEGGHLTPHTVHRVLYSALERAGIPRVGERGRKRDFHSFRHTFARIALEGGAEITWVKSQLGHSSIQLTVDVYGGWARSAQKAQAERLADAFTL